MRRAEDVDLVDCGGFVVAAGVVWLLVFLWGILAGRRKARKAAAAQDETLDQSENKS